MSREMGTEMSARSDRMQEVPKLHVYKWVPQSGDAGSCSEGLAGITSRQTQD